MKLIRSGGYAGVQGQVAAPAHSTPSTAVTIPADRGTSTATTVSGPAPARASRDPSRAAAAARYR